MMSEPDHSMPFFHNSRKEVSNMFDVNGTTITLSRGDTGSVRIKATAKRRDTGADYIFSARDRALFTIKGSNWKIQKICEIIHPLLTVTAAERSGSAEPITAALNKSVFNTKVGDSASGTVTLTYTTAWSDTPADYGITVTGTPVSGDVITVTYERNMFTVTFQNSDTDKVNPGGYSWDVRYVINPYYDEEGNIVDGDQVITPNPPMGAQVLTVVGDI